ncbi:MAG TPA: nitrile hydratase accessory protein [Acidimicrobiia bacterium]
MSELVSAEIREMDGPEALPRDNGELVFEAPWQGRVVGMAIGVVRQLGLDWDAFRGHLIREIAAAPGRPYYESWAAALEGLVAELRLVSCDELDERAAARIPR